MKTVKSEWESFEAAVMPRGAGIVQRQEMRRAFYAGAWSMLCAVRGIGDDSVSEEQGIETLEAMRRELEAFSFLVKKGRA